MKVFKRILSGTSAAVLTLSSLMTLGFTSVAHAAAQNCTWTSSSSTSFNTADNWVNCNSSVPQAGDNVIFTSKSGGGAVSLTNNLGHALGNVTVQTDGISAQTQYAVDTLTLASGSTIDGTQSANNNSGYTRFEITSLTAQPK
jgi:hypothetical protein